MQERCYLCKLPIALGFGPRLAGYCKCPIYVTKKPPCDCGNENASWHGNEHKRPQAWPYDNDNPIIVMDSPLLLEKQLAEARAEIERLNKNLRLLLCETHLNKCEAGLFNSKNPDDEPCLICLMGAAERGE